MKRHFFTMAILALLFTASACKRVPVDPGDTGGDTTIVTKQALKGTSWQLFGHLANRDLSVGPNPVKEKIFLTFSTETEAYGGTGRNKYTVNWKADPTYNIQFYNLVSTKVAVEENSYEGEYYRILSGARTYRFADNGRTLIISDGMESLYFHAEGHSQTPDAADVVRLVNFQVVRFHSDPFQVESLRKLDATHIAVKVSYSGGCQEHDFALYADENIRPGNATDFVNMMITHNANGDVCRAIKTQELVFDVTPLLKKWQSDPNSNHRLVLQFSQHNYIVEYTK